MKKTSIAILGLLLIIATAAVSFASKGFMNWNTTDWGNSLTDLFTTSETSEDGSDSTSDSGSVIDTTTLTQGMTIKTLSIGTDTNGHIYKDVSYSITPATASNQGIDVVLTMANSETVSNFMTAVKDEANKTIRFTNLAPFGAIITAKITSQANVNAFGTVTFNYVHKLLDLQFDDLVLSTEIQVDSDVKITETWSLGTKFAGDETMDGMLYTDALSFDLVNPQQYETYVGPLSEPLDLLKEYIQKCLVGRSLFSAAEIAAIGTGKSYQTDWYAYIGDYLANNVENFTIGGTLNADPGYTGDYVEYPVKTGKVFRLDMTAIDFSAYYTSVTNVNPETSTVDF